MTNKDYRAIYNIFDTDLQGPQTRNYKLYSSYYDMNVANGLVEAKYKIGEGEIDDWAIEVVYQLAISDGLTHEEVKRELTWYFDI